MRRLRRRGCASALSMVAILLLSTAAASAAELRVPLVIRELLPADDGGAREVAGRTRRSDPVTSGVPLKESSRVRDASELAVRDRTRGRLVPAQFRVLSRHPSGNVQWVLVDVQADLPAGGVVTDLELVRGRNPSGALLARDDGVFVHVDTGAAQFRIRKARQNVIDAVRVARKSLVHGGHGGGIVYREPGGTVYRSNADEKSTAAIEENGPLRAVVAERGRLRAEDGRASFGYTLRLTFYKSKSGVRAQVTIENAYLDSLTRKSMGAIAFRLPTVLKGEPAFVIAGKRRVFRGHLKPGETAYLYQAYTDHKRDSEAVRVKGAAASVFKEESDWGAPYTAAVLDAPLPARDARGRAAYPAALVGRTLAVRIDGGPMRRVTFTRSQFANAGRPLAREVAVAIQGEVRRQAGKWEAKAFLAGRAAGRRGVLRIESLGKGGRTSVEIGSGDANGTLGFVAGRRAEGRNGFVVRKGGKVLHDFGGGGDYSRGFADLSDAAGRGLSIAVRDFDSFFPSGIEFTGRGEVAVEIFSQHNARRGLSFDWGVHETREVLLDFHAEKRDPEETHYRIQYPLFARATYEQYRASGAILGRSRLVGHEALRTYHKGNRIAGVNQFAAANRRKYGVTEYRLPNQQIVRMRSYHWSQGGRQTNSDQSVPKLLGFLSTGHGGLYLTAYNLLRFVADQAVRHSDRGDRSKWPRTKQLLGKVGGPVENLLNGGPGKFEIDAEHMNVLGLPLLYYLTGDESLREALIDFGEWLLADRLAPRWRCGAGGRGHAQRARWHAILWQLTGDQRHKAEMDRLVDFYLCGAFLGGMKGRGGQDQDRGFFIRRRTDRRHGAREVHSPIANVRFEGIWELMHTLPGEDPRKEELADRLLGYAYFIAREYYTDRGGSPCYAFGGASSAKYEVDGAAPRDDAWRVANGFDWTLAMAHGYRLSADPWFLHVGRRIAGSLAGAPRCNDGPGRAEVRAVRQGYATYENWTAQNFIYTDRLREGLGVEFLDESNGLQVSRREDGAYVIEWTVPGGAEAYQIKYGPQPMVPNLNFDKYARTYEYDPRQFDNFWAGNGEGKGSQPRNVSDEPAPAAVGAIQHYTIAGLDPRRKFHFAMKVFTRAPFAGATPSPGGESVQ